MKSTLAIATTLLATLASQAAASFRIGYQGSDNHALPEIDERGDLQTIVFLNFYGDPDLELWEYETPEDSDGKVLIRNEQEGTYILCSAYWSECYAAEQGTLFHQPTQLAEIGGRTYYQILADGSDVDSPEQQTFALQGGNTLTLASPDISNSQQFLSIEEVDE
ncbi:hypothetical protein AtubIFM55763_000382 [Aspergillus tubingensis]|uniref:Uncharacterized protein n=2 Tax=Aspergillus subgen. Circumdati TaxID=2720871 RepID=A0A100IBA8_ASPNG|nr:uncharacterized protein AtWU_02808 [Aspergillus tubingensis]GAQ37630.1 hypothetical protein ABL_02231 [Aspergillus niger]GFN13010.1 hypothetical protein AtWU_02808 [Aspergillus tubingensis]GLA56843.1 hypothetical protein AtubIFM54640_000504 [Aspergillus tubingensis]GLA70351.1 hypothetical protein AtubIFM55763_000382 [Aspergillus tubingensis]GLA82321.1 hypothetical protein AtubIFM56815_006505 [Aspergillus tubingensis]